MKAKIKILKILNNEIKESHDSLPEKKYNEIDDKILDDVVEQHNPDLNKIKKQEILNRIEIYQYGFLFALKYIKSVVLDKD
jgi:hypothetical protein